MSFFSCSINQKRIIDLINLSKNFQVEYFDAKYSNYEDVLISTSCKQDNICKNLTLNYDPKLSLGYLPIGQVDLQNSFGTVDAQEIWKILGDHLNIQAIEVDGIRQEYDYCWSDPNYQSQQIDMMKPGYDYSSKYSVGK